MYNPIVCNNPWCPIKSLVENDVSTLCLKFLRNQGHACTYKLQTQVRSMWLSINCSLDQLSKQTTCVQVKIVEKVLVMGITLVAREACT